jgi:hypothetical protein
MGSLCRIRLRLLLLAAVLSVATIACGAIEGSPSPTPTPDAAQSMGLEIAQTYGDLLQQTRAIVEPRPYAAEAKERLRLLREEYKVHFGNYACLRDTLTTAEQQDVAAAFDANRETYIPADMAWLEDAASDYDLEDPAIRERLEEIETLHDFAFLERVAESRPGQELLCGG